MFDWETDIWENYLRNGKRLYINNKIVSYQEDKSKITAAVTGNPVYQVRLIFGNGVFKRGICNCPSCKMDGVCEHIAGVLYTYEAKKLVNEGQPEGFTKMIWEAEINSDIKPAVEKNNVSREKEVVAGKEAAAGKRATDRKTNSAQKKTRNSLKRQAVEEENKRQTAEEEKKRQARAEEKRRQEEERRRQEEEKRRQEEERRRQEEEKRRQEEERRRQEEEKRRQEEEKKRQEEEKAALAEREERDRKRLERERRKQEKAAKEAERQRILKEQREAEAAKHKAEEERREAIRLQKAQDAERRAEKRRQEEEAARLAANRREEEKRRQEEERKKELEEAIRETRERQRVEEQKAAMLEEKQKEEKRRLAERAKKNFILVGDEWKDDEEEDRNRNSEQLDAYRYFDTRAIRASVPVSEALMKKGRALQRKHLVQFQSISNGHMDGIRGYVGEINATGKEGARSFDIKLIFSRGMIETSSCGCSECSKMAYYMRRGVYCEYRAALLNELIEFLENHNIGDCTEYKVFSLLQKYGLRKDVLENTDLIDYEPQRLVPRLIKKDGELRLSFKFGENKLYVIKDLDRFYKDVENQEVGTYGSKTQIAHGYKYMDETSQQWYDLLAEIRTEELEIDEKFQKQFYGEVLHEKENSNYFSLYGWRLDKVYELLGKNTIEYEDFDEETKTKYVLHKSEDFPRLSLQISPYRGFSDKKFHGIQLQGSVPPFYKGKEGAYCLTEHTISKVAADLYQQIEPIIDLAEDDQIDLLIGRNNMTDFYHHVLPNLRDFIDIKESDAELIHSYLLPDAKFVFYLDAENDLITCEGEVRYGKKIFNLLDNLNDDYSMDLYRDEIAERRILEQTRLYLNHYDPLRQVIHNARDEEMAYQFYLHGIDMFCQLGEVHATKRFLNAQKIKKVSPTIGVQVSDGLLNLEIITQDLSEKELLDILKSYRMKKKYYRLKDGSFVNLEEDSLQTLAEMTEVLHLTKEELRQKTFTLPVYRALYLDKLLSENEELYEDRDATIRRMASQFKNLENSEFEVPKSLRKTLRGYQKEGFRWLKTLDSWGFGGILADEMGLGKTLQMITFLLSTKETGKEGMALIVCPASLVYNWEEEFHRFAPQLCVQTVTGMQSERNEILNRIKHTDSQEEKPDVIITSYDLLKRDIAAYDDMKFACQIIDEAQYIKNHTTAAAKSVKAIKSRVRFALTGTPVENRLSELWSIFDYLMPGYLYSYESFRKDYEQPIAKSQDNEALTRLQKLTGTFILRRRKEDVLKDLPDKLEEVYYVRMEEEQQHLYDGQLVQLRQDLANKNEQEFNKSKLQILSALTRLRQICCDPSLCIENYKGDTAKTDACIELLERAIDSGHRVLLFSQFTTMLGILQKRLEKAGISYYLITGSTSKEERSRLVAEFNKDKTPVFLISLKAGGVGLNLTGADMVIHYDPWWNIAAQNQATDRAHRIGQKKNVTVYKMITRGTIEEKILKLQEKKKELADQILNSESTQLSSLSKEELLDVLGN